jgi:methylmalonyl-CoA mutase N-terminal domain/subunit
MPTLLHAVRARATLGEVSAALGDVFGWWDESPAI